MFQGLRWGRRATDQRQMARGEIEDNGRMRCQKSVNKDEYWSTTKKHATVAIVVLAFSPPWPFQNELLSRIHSLSYKWSGDSWPDKWYSEERHGHAIKSQQNITQAISIILPAFLWWQFLPVSPFWHINKPMQRANRVPSVGGFLQSLVNVDSFTSLVCHKHFAYRL